MDTAVALSNLIHPQHTNLSNGTNRPMHIIGQLINDPWYTIDELRHHHKAKDSSSGYEKEEPQISALSFDVRESANYYFLEGEFPGIGDKNDIHIEWVGRRTLAIDAKVAKLDEEAEWGISLEGIDYNSGKGSGVAANDRDGPWAERKRKGLRNLLHDRHVGKLQRSFTFPNDVDVENLKARLSHGLLRILVMKLRLEDQEPRKRIEIED